MGRDKSDRVSRATYLDIHAIWRQAEIDNDCLVDVSVRAHPTSRSLVVDAMTIAYNKAGTRREFHTTSVVNSTSVDLPSAMYRALTRLYHDIGLWKMRTERLD